MLQVTILMRRVKEILGSRRSLNRELLEEEKEDTGAAMY